MGWDRRTLRATGRTALLAAIGATLLVVSTAHAVEICDAFGCTIYGPSSPGKPHNSRGMHATVTPSHGTGDVSFVGRASGFRPGEFVAVFKYLPNGRVAFMPSGGRASRTGTYRATVKNFAGIDIGGRYYLCFKGLRTGRVACGAFRYKAAAWGRRPFGGTGTVTPFNGPGGSGSGSGTTTGSNTSGSGTPTPTCTAWDVSGSWQWVADGFGLGPGNGPATLTQSGGTVTGTINDGSSSGSWTVSGSISGSTLSLAMNPPPGYANASYTGDVSSNKITGHNLGSFTNGTAKCLG